MYPDVFHEFAQFREEFGPVDGLPTRLFFAGSDLGEEFEVELETGKTLHLKIIALGDVDKDGKREVFCEVNGQLRTFLVDDKKEVGVRIYINIKAFLVSFSDDDDWPACLVVEKKMTQCLTR